MSTVEPRYARDRWCWPRSETTEGANSDDVIEIEVSGRGRVDSDVSDAPSEHSGTRLVRSSVYLSYARADERACRICLEEDAYVVESPCECTGTQRWVHRRCQARWRLSGGDQRRDVCEICRTPYTAPVPTVLRFVENRHTVDRSVSLNVAWMVSSGLMIVDIVDFIFYVHEVSEDDDVGHSWLQTMLYASSFLKAKLFFYVVCTSKKMRATLSSVLIVYMFGVLWEYTLFMHVVLNLSFNALLMGVMSHIDAVPSDDDNDEDDE